MLHGIDISKHNGNAEEFIKNASFVVIRAGYGKGHIDSKFEHNIKLCEKYGKPYGVYWFSYATTVQEAAAEAVVTIATINKYCKNSRPTLPVFIDWEEDSEKNLAKHGKTFTWNFYNEVVEEYCTILEQSGYFAGVYADYYHYSKLSTKKYFVWVAKWDDNENFNGLHNCIQMKQYKVDRTKNLDLNILKDVAIINIIKQRFNK